MHTHQKTPVERAADMAVEYWKPLAAFLLVVLVAVGGFLWRKEARAARERQATNLLYEAQVTARKAVTDKKIDEAERAYLPLVEKFQGTRAAFEAELQMGDIWMDAGSFDKAIAHYRAASAVAADSFSRLLAVYAVGTAEESASRPEQAVKAYEEALSIPETEFLRPELLMAQARCYEAMSQDKKAIEIYKVVQDKFASRTYYAGAASAYEKRLSAKSL